ncbi:hypothetical protein LL946_02655 [Knoellia locipacati]|uniref:HAAS signaling domain-containing protein n=1 Tax=Knoellia locipacati TaxID=882824 RepID=UPI00384D00BF
MTPAVTHPLVSAWLRDLELLLHGIDPGERAEVLAGVHEHLDATLPPEASDDDVRRTLAELGSPQSVADEAYAGRPPHVLTQASHPSAWPAVVASVINGAGLAVAGAITLLGAAMTGSLAPHPSEVLALVSFFAIPWLVGLILTSMAQVWGTADKVRSSLLYPGTLLALGASTWLIGLAGAVPLTVLTTVVVLAVAVRTLARLVRSALR